MQKFQGIFLQVASKGKANPLYLAISHDDSQLLGVQIYWSRKNKCPNDEDSEGCFSIYRPQRKLVCINSYSESIFSAEHVFIAVYSQALSVKVSLVLSFKTKICLKILNEHLHLCPAHPEPSKQELEKQKKLKNKLVSAALRAS